MELHDQLGSRKTAEQAVLQRQGPQGDKKAEELNTNPSTQPVRARRGLV